MSDPIRDVVRVLPEAMDERLTETAAKLAEQGAEQGREINEPQGRVDAHLELLQRDHAPPHGGLHDHPPSGRGQHLEEVLPWRNHWPEVLEFDMRVAELEQQQAAIAAKLQELRNDEIDAPRKDADRLADWLTEASRARAPNLNCRRSRRRSSGASRTRRR